MYQSQHGDKPSKIFDSGKVLKFSLVTRRIQGSGMAYLNNIYRGKEKTKIVYNITVEEYNTLYRLQIRDSSPTGYVNPIANTGRSIQQ